MNELGEWLTHARETRGLTLEDAERDTRISRRYLYALESGELDLIPAPVYARGFLRSYAQYLGLDPQEAMARYPRDDAGPYAVPQQQQRVQPTAPQRGQQRQQQQRQEPAPGTRSRPDPFGGGREAPPESLPRMPASRPSWRRPGPSSAGQSGSSPAPVQLPVEPMANEPMIGVNIGVPVPARRLQQDPAAQTRSVVVLVVALVAVLGILALAFLVSRLGGGDDENGSPVPTTEPGDNGGVTQPTPTTSAAIGGNGVVPDVIGELQADAVAAITAAGLSPNIRTEKNDATAGTVITQSPSAGTQREPGDPVTIIVSEGP